MPKTFRSHAVLMPPISENNRGIFGALDAIPLSGLFSQNSDQTMHFIAILKSRTVMENVINKYNLINFYKADNMEDAIDRLENNMRFDIDIEGCHIKGEYKGDHFREIVASGEHELCNRFNVKLGKDPDEYTDTIVRKDILDRINRLQNKKECKKMISKRACSRVPKCKWDEREEECQDTFGTCSVKEE